jgi:hypothetical protein
VVVSEQGDARRSIGIYGDTNVRATPHAISDEQSADQSMPKTAANERDTLEQRPGLIQNLPTRPLPHAPLLGEDEVKAIGPGCAVLGHPETRGRFRAAAFPRFEIGGLGRVSLVSVR